MEKLFSKNELLFAIISIVIYVVGMSLMENFSIMIGIPKLLAFIFALILSFIIFIWIKKSKREEYYGLTLKDINYSRYLFFIPLIVIVSSNLWLGVALNGSLLTVILSTLTMLLVGFLEEVIFRGFLFKAMEKDSLKSAIIVSSITFGLGHIINLFNGSGATLIDNMLQVVSAIAFGFLFVMIFIRSKSNIPCILTHSLINATSVFTNEVKMTMSASIIISLVLTAIALAYLFYICKFVKDNKNLYTKE